MSNRVLAAAVLCLSSPAIASADSAEAGATSEALPSAEEVDVDEVVRSARKELSALLARDAASTEDAAGGVSVFEAPAPSASDAPSAVGARSLPNPPAATRTRPDALSAAPRVTVGMPLPSVTSAVPAPPRALTAPNPQLTWLQGLSLPDIPIRWDDRLVRMLEYYRNDPRGRATVRGLLARQGGYGPMIRAKLRAARLPEDLIYLAMVESGFDPRARSDVGALGIWQLMTAPASEYQLEMSRWVDNRSCPELSTDAAITYLRDMYAELGSWPLSMAAFNMGYSALLRSIQKYNTNDFWLLSNLEAGLPYETINYVTKVMAYAIIGHNRARFGVADIVPDPPIETVAVEIAGGVSLQRVARSAGLDTEALADLNPELKKPRLPPDVKTWPLRIPKERAQRFRERWQSQGPVLPAHREHMLRLGERLTDVAELYGTSSAKLLQLNELPEGSSPRPGYKLIVPDVDPLPKKEGDKPTVGVPSDNFVYADRRRLFYRVCTGDELAEIARFFHVSSDEIRLWNRLAGEARLQRGMFLQLFVPHDAELSQTLVLAPNHVRTLVVGSEEFFNFHETQQNRRRLRYRVKPGDTLRSISERFELSIGSLARINQFGRDKKLEPDTEIIVYAPANVVVQKPAGRSVTVTQQPTDTKPGKTNLVVKPAPNAKGRSTNVTAPPAAKRTSSSVTQPPNNKPRNTSVVVKEQSPGKPRSASN